jgi:geranylgeranylglycerol-phosphate geranylgeranyltransferase
MKAYLQIVRPWVGALSAFAVLVGALVSGIYNPLVIIAVLVGFLHTSAGNTINDYFDYKTDKINRPKRPIPSGKISRKNALYFSIILFASGIFLSLFLTLNNILIALLSCALLILYSWRLKGIPLLGNISIGLLTSLSFIFGGILLGKLGLSVLILALISFAAVVGREIAKAIEDIDGDKKVKLRTLPIVTNKNFSSIIAIFFILFAVLFSPLPYLFNVLDFKYLATVIVADILYLASCFVIFVNAAKAQRMMRASSFIAILAFLIGAV